MLNALLHVQTIFKKLGKLSNNYWILRAILAPPDTFMINNSECKDAHVISESFNVYFTNIGPTLADKIPQTPKSYDTFMSHPPPSSFGLLPTSHAEIIQVSSLLKNSSSAGVDDINPSIERSSISLVATLLSWIINSSFNLGLFPDSLKIAKIIPIFKSGVSNLITNYRPISVVYLIFPRFLKSLWPSG